MIRPASAWVFALKLLQNSMMLTPRWPKAGPIGGWGFAAPAGICNLMYPVIFLAMVSFLSLFYQSYLVEAQFQRSRASKDTDQNGQFVVFFIHLVDHPVKLGERSVNNHHRLPQGEGRIDFGLFNPRRDLTSN